MVNNAGKWKAYGPAKTANALFANALSRRLRDSGGLAFSVHPGGIFTPLQRHLPKCEDCDIAAPTEPDSPMARFKGVNEHACSDESAEKLWAISEELLAQA